MAWTRRRTLSGIAAVMAGITGCSTVLPREAEPTDTPRYHYLTKQRTYTGPAFDIDLSPYTTIVDDPRDGDVALLARETTRPGEEILAWLLDGVAVGLYGSSVKGRFFDLLEETDFENHFGEGFVIGSPSDMMIMYPVPAENRVVPLNSGFADAPPGRTVAEPNRAREISKDLARFLRMMNESSDRHTE